MALRSMPGVFYLKLNVDVLSQKIPDIFIWFTIMARQAKLCLRAFRHDKF